MKEEFGPSMGEHEDPRCCFRRFLVFVVGWGEDVSQGKLDLTSVEMGRGGGLKATQIGDLIFKDFCLPSGNKHF